MTVLDFLNSFTENGALAFPTTRNANLDFFAQAGALRGRTDVVAHLFEQAYAENPALAAANLLHLRNVRGGAGERTLFRQLLQNLALTHPLQAVALLPLVPVYGRWDDLWGLAATPVFPSVLSLVEDTLRQDIESMNDHAQVSLLAKWLPSEGASNAQRRALAREFQAFLEFTPAQYRRTVSALRKHLQIVERQMSANEWEQIAYERVPSRASMIYRKAFKTHDEARYAKYLEAVAAGEVKINAGTLFPYELVRKTLEIGYDATIEAQWRALPLEMNASAIAVVDVSGSMSTGNTPVAPLHVALALGILMAERLPEPWRNQFITFSRRPQLQKLSGTSLKQKIDGMWMAQWDMNTDLYQVFELLTAALRQHPEAELPQMIVIISDMQFDEAVRNSKTNFQAAQALFNAVNRTMPTIVFWNVNATPGTLPVTKDEHGAVLISGFSQKVFQAILQADLSNLETLTPEYVAIETLSRYIQAHPAVFEIFAKGG